MYVNVLMLVQCKSVLTGLENISQVCTYTCHCAEYMYRNNRCMLISYYMDQSTIYIP